MEENAELISVIARFCSTLDIDQNQSFDKTLKQFLVISAVPKDQLSIAYESIGEDLSSVKYRSKRGLDVYCDPSTSPTYSKSFWGDLFQMVDISAVNDIGVYQNFKKTMTKSLKNCTERQKVLSYYLTVMKNKRGGYIAENLISKEVGRCVDTFKSLPEKDMAEGLGSMVASLKFPSYVDVKLRDVMESYRDNTKVEEKISKPQVQEQKGLSNVPQKKWDIAAKRKYSAIAIAKKYRETLKLKSHYPGKSTFKCAIGSVVASSDGWGTINNEIMTSNPNSKSFTQNELKEKLFGENISSEDWMSLLTVLDHCKLDDLMECKDVKLFIDSCQKALPVDAFATWSNVGIAKKFLTVYTPKWDKIWGKNWNITQSLKREINRYKKTHDKLEESTIKAICAL